VKLAQSFAGSGFARFINSPAGRVARIAAGLALFAWGYTLRASGAGIVLIVVGLVPLVAGRLDWCLISALVGGPIRGAVLRKTTQERG
jgi:hypothetical protein